MVSAHQRCSIKRRKQSRGNRFWQILMMCYQNLSPPLSGHRVRLYFPACLAACCGHVTDSGQSNVSRGDIHHLQSWSIQTSHRTLQYPFLSCPPARCLFLPRSAPGFTSGKLAIASFSNQPSKQTCFLFKTNKAM